jgi:hypothetical protein
MLDYDLAELGIFWLRKATAFKNQCSYKSLSCSSCSNGVTVLECCIVQNIVPIMSITASPKMDRSTVRSFSIDDDVSDPKKIVPIRERKPG